MAAIAIVGAGPGLGLSIARIFGHQGFAVALVARDQDKLDGLAVQLAQDGIEAAGFPADVMDRPTLVEAFNRIKDRHGDIEVLEYSPAPHSPVPGVTMADALGVTVDNVRAQLEFYLYGAITAVRQVLPAMIERGHGTLLFSTGASSVNPMPMMGNVGIASAGLRNWVLNLNQVLAVQGVYVAPHTAGRLDRPRRPGKPARYDCPAVLGSLHHPDRSRAPVQRLVIAGPSDGLPSPQRRHP